MPSNGFWVIVNNEQEFFYLTYHHEILSKTKDIEKALRIKKKDYAEHIIKSLYPDFLKDFKVVHAKIVLTEED